MFNLVKCIDPSTITDTMSEEEFTKAFEPAYGKDWEDAFKILNSQGPDPYIVSRLTHYLKEGGKFRELPRVDLPYCDLDDAEDPEYLALTNRSVVSNGMHRITAYGRAGMDIEFRYFYDSQDYIEEWTEVEAEFDISNFDGDFFDLFFHWTRSMELENGEWVESLSGSAIGDGKFYTTLDKKIDHVLLCKKLMEILSEPVFSTCKLVSLKFEDGLDEES